jgi:hypothetical protein
MNLHNIIGATMELIRDYCVAKFPNYWDWRITPDGLLEYSTDQPGAGENRYYYILQSDEIRQFTIEAEEWRAQGRPDTPR